MKHTITNRLAALLLLVIGVMGCSKEETLPSGTPDTARIPITISVTDGGYEASDPSTAQSRAMENGYATTFTEDDKIGLYVVKPDGSSYAHENIELTLTDNGDDTFVWTPPAGTMLYYDAEARYFAYYPYQSTLTGDLFPSATEATGFFADVVSKWTPKTDQSSYDLYTAQDLMIGSGTVAPKQADGTCPLALTMTHAMALVVIETPTTKYSLSDDANYTWTAAAPDTQFSGFTPYSPTGGTYRYLVKPAQSGVPDLYGSYTAASGNTTEYAIAQNRIAAASYVHSKVDGGGITEKTHTLQAGDFYLKDGSLVAKDATLTDAQAAACIGIVLKAGINLDGDWNDGCDYMLKGTTIQMSTIHGYVLALDDANNGKDCQWGSYGTTVRTDTEQYTGFYGYTNTNTIKAFATKNGNDLQAAFPVTYYATEGYEKTNPAPDNTSGWFLPSAGQCKFWYDNQAVLQGSGRKVTGNDGYNWKPYYWSSSENSSIPANYAWYLNFSNGNVYGGQKNNVNCVRSVLAF